MKFLPAHMLAVASLLLVGACGAPQQGAFTPAPIVPEVALEAAETHDPTEPFTVSAVDGVLERVTVTSDRAKTVDGKFSEDLTSWTSEGVLDAGSTHTVTAMAVSSDGTVTEFERQFTTEGREGSGFSVADVTPVVDGETVGVGAPIIVTFTEAAPDRAMVEAQLQVESEKDHEGAWRWMSDTQVIYRTKEYWDAHQTVTFTATFDGVLLGEDTWGSEDYTAEMEVGPANISYTDVNSHYMTVEIDGEVAREIPISAGSGEEWEYHTATGVHLVMEKLSHKVMVAPGKEEGDEGYYETPVNWATRINASGEFVHGAPWSVYAQGNANVSHGCLNASEENAKWFYEISQRGDPVEVVGSPREMPWTNGWGYWVLSFDEWKEGSAL
ncbi:Ig-like domain-containing protein [Glycomyces sp. L485]|uniref:L,D-transpeptidase n=1 Tax=Glycomyces sp. L485 TaxID=2909235 RepID=UPI001F4A32F8|nr:Ig-like domain-containing protein [Glycomyces sp. L485]MCH7231253.1 Ig-like domain-containing protein [Glycomyces sp. L485]